MKKTVYYVYEFKAVDFFHIGIIRVEGASL
jgi:hypothetical protein